MQLKALKGFKLINIILKNIYFISHLIKFQIIYFLIYLLQKPKFKFKKNIYSNLN